MYPPVRVPTEHSEFSTARSFLSVYRPRTNSIPGVPNPRTAPPPPPVNISSSGLGIVSGPFDPRKLPHIIPKGGGLYKPNTNPIYGSKGGNQFSKPDNLGDAFENLFVDFGSIFYESAFHLLMGITKSAFKAIGESKLLGPVFSIFTHPAGILVIGMLFGIYTM